MRHILTQEEKDFRRLQTRWRRSDSQDTFSASELIQLSEYYLGQSDLEDAGDPLEVLQTMFPEFRGRHDLALANSAIHDCWKSIRDLKESLVK